MKGSFDKLNQDRYSERIAAQIQSLIVSNKLVPGSRLPPERELAEQFGVSRTAIREAVKILQERGLVDVRRGRGILVTQPDLGTVTSSISVASQMRNGTLADLLEARQHLEVSMVNLAVQRATPSDIAKLEAIFQEMEAASPDSDDFIQADLRFHSALAAATQNPFFLILSHPLEDLLQRARRIGIGAEGTTKRAQVYHKQILDCVRDKDAVGAQEAIVDHLNQFRQDLEIAGLKGSDVLLDKLFNGYT